MKWVEVVVAVPGVGLGGWAAPLAQGQVATVAVPTAGIEQSTGEDRLATGSDAQSAAHRWFVYRAIGRDAWYPLGEKVGSP